MYPLTATQLTALTASGATILRRADVCDTSGSVIQTLDVTAGLAQENETTEVRWTCAATINTLDLVPGQIGDLLHPLSGNELRLYKGGNVGGVAFWVPMGVYRMSRPDSTDTGASVATVLTGNDRSSEISRRAWTEPYTPTSGWTVEQVIADVLNLKWTGSPLQMNLYTSGLVVPDGTVLGMTYTSSGFTAESGSTSGQNDPWADLVLLAKSAGCELFFDRTGAVVMRPVPQIGTLPDATPLLQEGVNCVVTQMERKLDETSFRNLVQVVGTGATVTNSDGSISPGAPVYAEAASTDPLLGPGGPLGARPEQITDQTIATVPDAQTRADAELALIQSTLDDTSLAGVDVFWVDCGDTIPVTRSRMRVNAGYVPQVITHPLDLATTMQVTFRPFSIVA